MQSVSVQNLNMHRTFSTVAKHRLSVCQCVRLSDRLHGCVSRHPRRGPVKTQQPNCQSRWPWQNWQTELWIQINQLWQYRAVVRNAVSSSYGQLPLYRHEPTRHDLLHTCHEHHKPSGRVLSTLYLLLHYNDNLIRQNQDPRGILRARYSYPISHHDDWTLQALASLRLVSPGAIIDGVTLFTSKVMTFFSHRPTDYRHHSHRLRLSRWLFVQCCCKFIRKKEKS